LIICSFDDLDIYFEGDIYNKLKFSCDDEFILLKTFYTEFGFDFLDKLDGIFAFCIFDKKKNLYFCSRDRFGNIPFFYYIKNETFLFSTSIKNILKNLNYLPSMNKVALSKYIQYFATFKEDTFYQNIFRLEEATYLIYENKKELIKKRYYKIKTYKTIKDEKIALKDIEDILFKALEKRVLNSPSVLLSGGIDSSFISAVYTKISSKKINTFSIGYNDYKNYCELDFAKITANHIKSNHNEIVINKKDYINSFYNTLDMFDEPHCDSAIIPLNILLSKIKKSDIKYVLSGEGSDEIFLGYDNYIKFLKYYSFAKSLSKEQNLFLNEIISALQNNTKESEYLRRVIKKQNIYNSFGEIYTDIQKKRLFKKVPTFKNEKAKQNPVDNMSYIDLKIWIANAVLTKVYNLSNINSLQIHTPFLDRTLVDYIFTIQSDIKLGSTNKYLLKKIASKYLPKDIINRTKKGFNSPYNEWLQQEFKDSILSTILEVNKITNFFNDEYIKYIYSLASSNKFKQHLYSLFVFSLWYKRVYL